MSDLFRQESIRGREESLAGDVRLFIPLPWQAIGYFIFTAALAACLFLFIGTYTRIETISGQIEPDLGSAAILPSRSGIVADIDVHEGDVVKRGATLATIKAEELDESGQAGPMRALSALRQQDARLDAQQQLTLSGSLASRARIRAQQAGLRAELKAIDSQLLEQDQLIASARDDLARVQEIAARGFISRKDIQAREDLLATRVQERSILTQTQAGKRADLEQALRSVDETSTQAQAAAAAIAGDRAAIAQRESDVIASRGYRLTAPIAGVVTAVTAHVGQSVQPPMQLMTIVPSGARMQAWLYAPTRSAGFLANGQRVRLQIDAFPYEQFGTVEATVASISGTTVTRALSNGQSEPTYIVIASIADPKIWAFGRYRRVRADMSVSASIITRRRSLGVWLLEPLFAARRE